MSMNQETIRALSNLYTERTKIEDILAFITGDNKIVVTAITGQDSYYGDIGTAYTVTSEFSREHLRLMFERELSAVNEKILRLGGTPE